MEKHKCKLCLRSFGNGRALGGHMRSHLLNLPTHQLSENTDSPHSAYSSSDEEDEDKSLLSYSLRENPKKSVRLVDPEFSFTVDHGSLILQDRESETESSKNPIRRRSKRIQMEISDKNHYLKEPEVKKTKWGILNKAESSMVEPEPVSSISETTSEENIAYCLMMLSRDTWTREEEEGGKNKYPVQEACVYTESEDSDDHKVIRKTRKTRVRGKYKCETCKKVFKSYQALGGHRASHKKIKANNNDFTAQEKGVVERENGDDFVMVEEKIYECPICYRVFSSGQALGGHKRSHGIGSAIATSNPDKPVSKFGGNLIDLNLPAPIDDDDDNEISQIEFSAVSDAEFVNPIQQ